MQARDFQFVIFAGAIIHKSPCPVFSLPLRSTCAESDKWLSRWRDQAGKVGSAPSSPVFSAPRFFLSPSRRRRGHQPARSWCPLKTTPTGEGSIAKSVIKGVITLLNNGKTNRGPEVGTRSGSSAINRLACSARALASFASYADQLLSHTEIVSCGSKRHSDLSKAETS